ncbi:RnfABCDGE type electron transport complex subunit G [Peptoniphilus sp. KCTC 25270]|uniref:RnfABCDGE type electron transport complex subunit G n=1 Tax=Peptoniphilus sp. KCTC 25270 TaxID=2897414 RepID=UPI001E3DFC6F|nr:RnfABCDGE type electron transport complex subunit G [Peptoniphilus sp. KCTC 25270]MCD1146902.1 RnfABCDGE type electron transport complex subunit G [Peptoniphilus sp. KCTC 25270]
MKEYLRLGLVLLIFSAAAGAILAAVNGFTSPVIAEAEFQKSVEAYVDIYGDLADDFEPMEDAKKASLMEQYPQIADIFVAKKGGEVVGYGVNFYAYGYGGQMQNAVGLLNDKTIAGFRNIQNAETPGIGTKITEPTYYEKFAGKNFSGGELVGSQEAANENEAPLISGATVSTSAVLDALNSVLVEYDTISAQ